MLKVDNICQLHVPIVQISWKPQPPGALRVCPGQYKDCFTGRIELYFAVEWIALLRYTEWLWVQISVLSLAIRNEVLGVCVCVCVCVCERDREFLT